MFRCFFSEDTSYSNAKAAGRWVKEPQKAFALVGSLESTCSRVPNYFLGELVISWSLGRFGIPHDARASCYVFVLYLGSALRNVASHGGRSCWMYEGIPDAGWWFGTWILFFQFFPYIGNNHPNWLHIFQRGRSTTNQDVSEQISTGLVLVRFSPQQSPVRSGGFEYCYGASRPCCHLGPGFSTSEVSQTLDSFNGIDPYASVADCRCVPYLSAHTHFEASGFRLCLPIGQLVQRVLFLKQRLFNATQLAGFEPTSQLLPMRRFIFRTVPATSCRIGGVGIGCSQCSWCQSQLPTIFVDAPLLQLVVSLEPLALGTISGGQWDVTAGSRSGGSLDFRSAVAK